MSVRFLFVCAGNTCRSPMAAALTKHIFGAHAHAESAGVSATPGEIAAENAAHAIKDLYGLCYLFDHRSRSIEAVDLNSFDWIVALDAEVGQQLRSIENLDPHTLLEWNVPDPWDLGPGPYRDAARSIEGNVRSLAPIISASEPALPTSASIPPGD